MRKQKIICLAAAAAVCISMLAACGGASNASQSASSEQAEPTHEIGLFVDNKKIDVDTVLTIEGKDISFDEYRYYYLSTRSRFDGGDITLWKDASSEDSQEILKRYVLESIQSMAAFEALAKENNISLSSDEKASVENSISEAKKSLGSDDAYNEALAEMYFTPELYKTMLEQNMLASKVIKELYGDEIKKDIESNYVREKHILIKYDDETLAGSTANGDNNTVSKEQAKATADEILKKIKDGGSFDTMLNTYNEDIGENTVGAYITDGVIYEDVKKLENDAISEVIETNSGYYIVKRLALDDEYVEENMLALMSSEMNEKIDADVQARIGQMDVKYSDVYDEIKPDTIY